MGGDEVDLVEDEDETRGEFERRDVRNQIRKVGKLEAG